MFKKLFWKTYQVTRTTIDGAYKNVYFLRGFTWDVVDMAQEDVEEKSEQEGQKWVIIEIKRI